MESTVSLQEKGLSKLRDARQAEIKRRADVITSREEINPACRRALTTL